MAYSAPQAVQSAWDQRSPEQQRAIAQQIGFDWHPGQNDAAFNSFVEQSPGAFEGAVTGSGQPQFRPVEPSGFNPSGPSQQPYSAPPAVQSAWDARTPQQQQTIAQQVGFNWTPGQNDAAFNSFVGQAPGAFESAVGSAQPTPTPTPQAPAQQPYQAPAWAQGVWNQLQPWQQTQVANQTGFSGAGQDRAFNDYVVQNNKAGDFQNILGHVNPQTYGMASPRQPVPQGAQGYGFDSGFGYSVGQNAGYYQGQSPGIGWGQGAGTGYGNFLSGTPSAQGQPMTQPAPGMNDSGAAARGAFQF